MRTEQNDCGAAGLDAVVLQDEALGGACDCGGGARRDSDCAGESAPGIFQLDEEYPGLDAVAAALVGAPDSGVVLRRLQADQCGGGCAREMHEVRVWEAE